MTPAASLILVIVMLLLVLVSTTILILPILQSSTLYNSTDREAVREFYEEKNDTLDGIYIGSSGAYRYWIPPAAYGKTGMAVYCLATAEQPICIAKNLIIEAQKTQHNLKFVVIELRNISKQADAYRSLSLKKITDEMPWSSNRSDMIKSYIDYCSELGADVDTGVSDYYFPFLRDYGKWLLDVNKDGLHLYTSGTVNNRIKGCYPHIGYKSIEPKPEYNGNEDLEPAKEKMLNELLDYCETLDIDVIFSLSPTFMSNDRMAQANTAVNICRSRGFTVLDFTKEPLRSAIDFDFSRDFYDSRHVSYTGGLKYTEYMSDYLCQHYNLTDHRGDPDYESWDNSIKELESYINDSGEN